VPPPPDRISSLDLEPECSRTINEAGEAQCRTAAGGWLKFVRPVRIAMHSEAGRTAETVKLLLADEPECPVVSGYTNRRLSTGPRVVVNVALRCPTLSLWTEWSTPNVL
jgi:hypothetical protein